MSIFEGSAVALVTPFTENGINYDALKHLIDFQIENGTDAILVCGTTGEPATMDPDEKHRVMKAAVEYVGGRVPLILGTGGNNTEMVIRESQYAESIGADALLVVTPFYNKCSQEGLYQHYMKVADSVNTPIIIYNVPSRTGVNVLPATYERLAPHENLQGIKEASGNISQILEIARVVKDNMTIYSGNDDQTVPIMALGGKGVISVTANIAPKMVHDMCRAYLDGDHEKALEYQLRYNPLNNIMFSDVNPIPVKTALNLMGFKAGPLRLPLCSMSETALGKLKEVLASYSLI